MHDKLGLIVTGANSKRQPEPATFSETIDGETIYMPISSRLQMSDAQDRLSLAFNTFFSDLLHSNSLRQRPDAAFCHCREG